MGIQGLLQFLKEASEPVHVKKYKGQTVAVDTYCWLHKGAFACAEKLAKGEPTDQYVSYCMKFVHMLQSFDVKPILIFDGCSLPSKKDVEKARHERRKANLQKGKQLLREGKLSEARECFSRSVNITSSMAHDLIKAARSEGVDCVVAPYEADAQLAYMNKSGYAQAVITEDSDLLAFGCKKVILKMDKYGNGMEIDQARLGLCKHLGDTFTEEKFRYMCILSGCDYLPSIHGIGLVKACKLLKTASNPDIIKVIKKIGTYLKMNLTIPEGYIEGFVRANNTFLYQLVFDPIKRKLVPLNPYEDRVDLSELNYAGTYIDDSAALQVALGNVDIHTMNQIDDYNPDTTQTLKHRTQDWNSSLKKQKNRRTDSIWNKNYLPHVNIVTQNKAENTEEKYPRGLITIRNANTLKRLHDGGPSDAELFTQYSFPKAKKARKDCEVTLTPLISSNITAGLNTLSECVLDKESKSQPKIRNTFSKFLQRNNEKSSLVSETGTRSRFFCMPTDFPNRTSKHEVKQLEENVKADIHDNDTGTSQKTNILTVDCDTYEKVDPLSPVSCDFGLKTIHASPRQPKSCFSWSGSLTSGTSGNQSIAQTLRRFQRIQPVTNPNVQNYKSPNRCQPDCDNLDHPSKISPTVCLVERQHNFAVLEKEEDSSSEEPDDPEYSQTALKTSPAHNLIFSERKAVTSNIKVSGLLKSKPVNTNNGNTFKSLAPGKVSGLSSKRHKKASENENQSGLQATINDLWKNFGFKKRCEPPVV